MSEFRLDIRQPETAKVIINGRELQAYTSRGSLPYKIQRRIYGALLTVAAANDIRLAVENPDEHEWIKNETEHIRRLRGVLLGVSDDELHRMIHDPARELSVLLDAVYAALVDQVMALIPGLTQEEAELLVSDEKQLSALLEYLGFGQRPDDEQSKSRRRRRENSTKPVTTS